MVKISKEFQNWAEQQIKEGYNPSDLNTIGFYQKFVNDLGSSLSFSSYSRYIRVFVSMGKAHDPFTAGKEDVFTEEEIKDPEFEIEVQDVLTDDARDVLIRSQSIKTLDDLIEFVEIDMTQWKVVGCIASRYGGTNSPMGQVKAKFERRQVQDLTFDDYKRFYDVLANNSNTPLNLPKVKYNFNKKGSKNALEISITDHHWDLRSPEDNRTVEERTKYYIEVVNEILRRAKPYNIKKIFFIIGNDFFNSDTLMETTTRGTSQDDIVNYEKSFIEGVQMIIESVKVCRRVAPVEIIGVKGNHDAVKVFHACCMLDILFKNDKNITINNDSDDIQRFIWGKVFVGLTHKLPKKAVNFPLLLARKFKEEMAVAEYIEIHLGHLHKEKGVQVPLIDEEVAIKIRNLPSLCSRSDWTINEKYKHLKQTEAFVWNDEIGLEGIIPLNPLAIEEK